MRVFHTLDIAFPSGSTCVALGLFDGLHPGHLSVIRAAVEEAKRQWKIPCIFTFSIGQEGPPGKQSGRLASDEAIEAALEELGVECIVRPDFADFRELSPQLFVQEVLLGALGASSAFCGENFRFGKNASGDTAALARFCGDVCSVHALPLVEKNGQVVSSSNIRSLLRAGDVEAANSMLDQRFTIDFEVVHGRALGRTLGSPTINQPFPVDFIQPKFGVYATITRLNGRVYSSVTNVGIKPTVGSDRVLAETYIHGFSGDLYGQKVQVEFLKFIRPERKFLDVDELRLQIAADSASTAKIASALCGEEFPPEYNH